MTALLEMRHVTKRFPGVIALNDISIEIKKGEILAICGENGAGKSTLMNVLSGKFSSHEYEGQIFVDGEEVSFSSVSAAKAKGIEMVHQELNVLYDSSIAENIFVGNLPNRHGVVDYKTLYQETKEALDFIGLDVSPKLRASLLNSGQLQMMSIMRAVKRNPRILVLDEPTSALTDTEIDKLMDLMNTLREQGISCVFISHKLEEVFRISDRVVVMRDGQFVSCYDIHSVTKDRLIADMVGRELGDMYPERHTEAQEEVFRVEDLTVPHPTIHGRNILQNVGFTLKKGEILGIGGLVGSGRSEAMMAIFGADKRSGVSCKTWLKGNQIRIRSPKQALDYGFGFVTEERKLTGYIPIFSVCRNLSLAILPKLRKGLTLDRKKETALATEMFRNMRIKAPDLNTQILQLSGGNQQKVILGKWLLSDPEILIIDEPTKGIDVGAKAEFYKILNQLTEKGVSIIMVSSDMPELISMSDRILVFGNGQITAELTGDQITQENVLKYAL